MNEVWIDVAGYEGLYQVSNKGRVLSLTREGLILSPATSPAGYLRVSLHKQGKGKSVSIHRLVIENFVGPQPFEKAVTRHLDGNPANNSVENLKWGTQKENCADRIHHGRFDNLHLNQCKSGHEFTPDNTYINPSRGVRQCRICRSIWQDQRQANKGLALAQAA